LEVVKQSGLVSGYIRPIIYPGASVWLDPTDAEIHTEVSAVPFPSYLWEKPIRVKIAKTRRVDPRTVDMGAKICGNYINSARAKLEVKKQKFDEWLLLDTSDNIAEGPGANIFFIAKAGSRKVYTPQLWTILPGITRATIMQLFKDKYGVEVIEETISPERLWEFSEAFFVWTAAEVTPIASITNEQNKQFDFLSCEDDSLSNQMKKIYLDVVSGKDSDYLTYLS
jgi:branched-chain amino acid aminotransferase